MMSRNVRRLVLDPFPLWQLGLGLLLWLVIGAMTALWAWKMQTVSLTMAFSTVGLAMGFMMKVRAWETLPVSRSELGQAQWWYLWGRPFVLVAVVTAIAVAVDGALGILQADWADIGAYLCAEITLLFLSGLMAPIGGLARRLGQGGTGMVTIAVALATLGLAFHWSLDGSVAVFRSQMVLGGLVSIGLALVALLLSRWIPLARPQKWGAGKASKADNVPSQARRKAARPVGAVWLAAFILGRQARVVPFFALLVIVLTGVTRLGVLKDILPADIWLQFVPLFGGVSVMAMTAMMSQRMLAGLPLSALQRTVALQGAAPALQVPLLAVTVAAGAALGSHGVSAGWLMGTGLTALAAVFMSAIALPMFLRFGPRAPLLFIGILAGPIGATTGISTAAALHARHIFGLPIDLGILVLAVGLAALVPLGWVWTWLELAHGRAAYRQRLTAFTTWRGQ